MNDPTLTFRPIGERDAEMKRILLEVFDAIVEKGYDAPNQIVGYILSEDPTYITTNRGARALITKLDRDELLRRMVLEYIGK